jgi:hypothetical protein
MIYTRTSAVPAAALLAMLVGACAAPQPPKSWDGLEYRAVKGMDAVYLRPGVGFTSYQSVLIDPVEVSFDASLERGSGPAGATRRLGAGDLEAIKDRMATDFHRILSEELSGGGYRLVSEPAAGTLRLSPSLVDVYASLPGEMTPGRSRSYTLEAGRMTLVMELRDGLTGQLLARIVDQKAGTRSGELRLDSTAPNSADFQRAVSDWARKLREGLDAVTGKAP